jgi:hypothetical protein
VLQAATPAWFADNIAPLSLVTLVLLTLGVLRLVERSATRLALLGLIVAVAVFVVLNRDQLETCARTCECQIVEQEVDVPFCDPDLELSAPR